MDNTIHKEDILKEINGPLDGYLKYLLGLSPVLLFVFYHSFSEMSYMQSVLINLIIVTALIVLLAVVLWQTVDIADSLLGTKEKIEKIAEDTAKFRNL